jgi:hypothetical protein
VSRTEKSRWLLRQEVTEGLNNKDVLVRSRSGKVSKATILRVSHDCEGIKKVHYESQGKRLTKLYEISDRITDFALR